MVAISGIGSVDEGVILDDKWIPGRRLNGDENDQGRRWRFGQDEIRIERCVARARRFPGLRYRSFVDSVLPSISGFQFCTFLFEVQRTRQIQIESRIPASPQRNHG